MAQICKPSPLHGLTPPLSPRVAGQSQVYRSQPDLTAYDTTAPIRGDPYRQYAEQTDNSQNYTQYTYPADYSTTESTWIAPEQRKDKRIQPQCLNQIGPII